MKYVLDTHVWIWLCDAPEKISARAGEALMPSAASELILSAISVWETAKLVEKGRLAFSRPLSKWVKEALEYPGLRVCELTPDIAVASTQLPPGLPTDPADQIIVATSLELGATLITADARLHAYPHVAALW